MVFCCLNQPITKPVYVSTGRPILFEIVSGPWFLVAFSKYFALLLFNFHPPNKYFIWNLFSVCDYWNSYIPAV